MITTQRRIDRLLLFSRKTIIAYISMGVASRNTVQYIAQGSQLTQFFLSLLATPVATVP